MVATWVAWPERAICDPHLPLQPGFVDAFSTGGELPNGLGHYRVEKPDISSSRNVYHRGVTYDWSADVGRRLCTDWDAEPKLSCRFLQSDDLHFGRIAYHKEDVTESERILFHGEAVIFERFRFLRIYTFGALNEAEAACKLHRAIEATVAKAAPVGAAAS